jgi:glucose/arabinose dehydrogenase
MTKRNKKVFLSAILILAVILGIYGFQFYFLEGKKTAVNNFQDNWQVSQGFKIEKVAEGFDLPVNLAFVANPGKEPKAPLFYVTELYGKIKVVTNDFTVSTFAENLLNFKPTQEFPGSGENGVIGIVTLPNSGDVIASLVYEDAGAMRNKVVRLKSKDGLKSDSSEIIIDNIPSVRAAHQVQAVSIGYDEKLYVNVGDAMVDASAQDDNDLRGKILRLNLDGTIPRDNPNPKSPVFAKGLRNPFGAAWRNSNKSLYVTDNGPAKDDRIVRIEAGKNYGWPGSTRPSSIFWWERIQAPTALAFAQNSIFPEEFNDQLFVNLFGGAYEEGRSVKGKKMIKIQLDENDRVLSYDEFATYVGRGPASPCGLAFGPDGLYFTDLFGEKGKGNVYRIVPEK